MPTGLPGADSSTPVTAEIIESAQRALRRHAGVLGPLLNTKTTGEVEYRHATESPVPVAGCDIRLLPIARQTTERRRQPSDRHR